MIHQGTKIEIPFMNDEVYWSKISHQRYQAISLSVLYAGLELIEGCQGQGHGLQPLMPL